MFEPLWTRNNLGLMRHEGGFDLYSIDPTYDSDSLGSDPWVKYKVKPLSASVLECCSNITCAIRWWWHNR